YYFFFQAEDGIRDKLVTGVQTCALPISYFIPDWPQTPFVRAARRLLSPIVRPPFDIMGPRFVSWLIAWPRLFRRSPRALQDFLKIGRASCRERVSYMVGGVVV